MKRFVWVVFLSWLPAPFAEAGPLFGDPKVTASREWPVKRGTLESRLSGYERIPSARELLRDGRSSEELVRDLIGLANDSSKPSWLRTRAIALLGHFDRPEARSCVLALAQDRASKVSVARAAILAARDKAAIPTVLRFLEHPEAALREAAFRTLARQPTLSIRKRLRAAQAAETLPHLAERYARYMRRK